MATEQNESTIVAIAGVPVRVRANSRVVIAMATSRFPEVSASTHAAAYVDVRVTNDSAVPRDPMQWSLDDVRDELRMDAGVFRATAQMTDATATLELTETALTDWPQMRRAFEGLLLSLVNRRDRHPIHAATLASHNSALVLHGRSGVGKSTLAWEAHRGGICVISDDASRIQRSPELRVWGDGTPPRILLLEAVRDRYAELRSLRAEPMGGDNEPKAAVRLDRDAEWTPSARNPRVVLLSRSGAPRVSVTEVGSDEIYAALMAAPEAEMDLSPRNREGVLRALAARGGFRMDLSPRAADAVPVLKEFLANAPA
jgi:hypothetical protein